MATRDKRVKMPEVEWWEVFDCEREELGFLVVGMRSLEGMVERERSRWDGRGMIDRGCIKDEMTKMGVNTGNGEVLDEEAEMARMLDEKVGASKSQM